MSNPLWPEIRAAKNGVFWEPVGTLFTVNGTMVSDPFGPGYPGDVARALIEKADGLWIWQPIGYPAAVFPMGPSVQAGRQQLICDIGQHPGRIALSGYSQGAMVVDIVWRDDILNPSGSLHHRKDDVVAIVNFGDPMRCPGIANGNKYAGAAPPTKSGWPSLPNTGWPTPEQVNLQHHTTGGIAGPGNLTPAQTPDFLLSFANDGDLFACSPTGDDPWHHETEVGKDERLIFDIVQNATPETILAIAEQVAKIIQRPLTEIVDMAEAIANGLVFASAGNQAPHWKYTIGWAVDYLIERGNQLRERPTDISA